MTLRQQLIADRVTQLTSTLQIKEDQAFEKLVYSLITGQSVHSLSPTDWVDGSQDKQIDIIFVDEGSEEAEIFIISAKFTPHFSSNALILCRNGLKWIFNRPRAEVDEISNEAFREKIYEIRTMITELGPSNIAVRCYFATNGISTTTSTEYNHELKALLSEYDNGTFSAFTFQTVGSDELVGLLKRIERKNRSVTADVPIRYDANTPSFNSLSQSRAEGGDMYGFCC